MNIIHKKIIFTGGGSAGHVTPNIALIEKFLTSNWEINYIGSKTGIEKELITRLKIPYYNITTGKLRRYFSWQNFLDPLKIIYGIIQALLLCIKLKPNIIFSKGGFVSFPVVIAAWTLRIPVIIHESDLTIGLANKISFPFATKICVTFPNTYQQLGNKKKAILTGIPIRKDFFMENADKGREICNFTLNKKIILVFGGSLGADFINNLIRKLLPQLLPQFQIIHICGKNKIDPNYQFTGYQQFEYLHNELPHFLAAADLVISRAGANSIYELLILRKPNILLPLSANASRGDQIVNAKYCVSQGFSEMLLEKELSAESLLEKINLVNKNQGALIAAMNKFEVLPATEIICQLLEKNSC